MPNYAFITAEIRTRIAAIPGLRLIDDPGRSEECGKDKTPDALPPARTGRRGDGGGTDSGAAAPGQRLPLSRHAAGAGNRSRRRGDSGPGRRGPVAGQDEPDHRHRTPNMIAVVEPGVLNLDLKNAVREHGLCYPPDPASNDTCSIGGNAATNAGGPACVKYGTTRDYILGLEAVLPERGTHRDGRPDAQGGGRLRHDAPAGRLRGDPRGDHEADPPAHPPSRRCDDAGRPVSRRSPRRWRRSQTILMRGHTPSTLEFMDSRCLALVGDLLPFPGSRRPGRCC